MKPDHLLVGRQEIATIQIDKLTPARIFVINEYLQTVTEETVTIDVKGNVSHNEEGPYEIDVLPDKITVYRVVLIPEECISKGIRLTPVE